MTKTVTVQIKSRWNDSILFGADIAASLSEGLRIKGALELAVKGGAYLGDANLGGAYLGDANLGGAYLGGAYLGGANLGGANLGEGVFYVDGGRDRRGYAFYSLSYPDNLIIRAGCRKWASFDKGRAHFGKSYRSDGDPAECLARLNLMEALVTARRAALTQEPPI